jgi:glucokinase
MAVLACDIGGTRIKLGLVEQGALLGKRMIPAESAGKLTRALPRIEAELKALCKEVGYPVSACAGLAVGFPALVNVHAGRVINAYGKFEDAPGVDLQAWSEQVFGLPFAIDNDARVAALGEWRYGAGLGCDSMAMVTLGTGIGTAIILEGHLLRGPHYQAGNLCSHLVVEPHGVPCVCGNRGCIEAETGSAGLAARVAAWPGFKESALAGETRVDYRQVFAHAAEGDAVATQVRDRAMHYWGILCTDLSHAFDVERVVIGGGIMASADLILPALQRHVDTCASTPWGRLEVVAAKHPDHMALLGCELLLEEKKQPA